MKQIQTLCKIMRHAHPNKSHSKLCHCLLIPNHLMPSIFVAPLLSQSIVVRLGVAKSTSVKTNTGKLVRIGMRNMYGIVQATKQFVGKTRTGGGVRGTIRKREWEKGRDLVDADLSLAATSTLLRFAYLNLRFSSMKCVVCLVRIHLLRFSHS